MPQDPKKQEPKQDTKKDLAEVLHHFSQFQKSGSSKDKKSSNQTFDGMLNAASSLKELASKQQETNSTYDRELRFGQNPSKETKSGSSIFGAASSLSADDTALRDSGDKLQQVGLILKAQEEVRSLKTKRVDESISNALGTAQLQESHYNQMQKDAQDIRGLELKNEKAEAGIEIDKAKAVAQGLEIAPQDPIQVDQATKEKSNGFDSLGSLGSLGGSQNQPKTLPETGKTLTDAVADGINKNKEKYNGQQNHYNSNELAISDYIQEELKVAVDGALNARTLRNGPLAGTPLGGVANLVGGVLNLVTGPLDLGDMILGGEASEGSKARFLADIGGRVSPLVSAGMRDALGKKSAEIDYFKYLSDRGLKEEAFAAKNMDDALHVEAISVDLEQVLMNHQDTKAGFGNAATMPFKTMFNLWQNIAKTGEEINEAQSDAQAFKMGNDARNMQAEMIKSMREYLATGGSHQQFDTMINMGIDAINEQYNQPLPRSDIPGNKEARSVAANEKHIAGVYVKKLDKFRNVILSRAEADIDGAIELKVGAEAYADRNGIDAEVITTGRYPGSQSKSKLTSEGIDSIIDSSKKDSKEINQHPLLAKLKKLSIDQRSYDKLKLLILKEAGTSSKQSKLMDVFEKYEGWNDAIEGVK